MALYPSRHKKEATTWKLLKCFQGNCFSGTGGGIRWRATSNSWCSYEYLYGKYFESHLHLTFCFNLIKFEMVFLLIRCETAKTFNNNLGDCSKQSPLHYDTFVSSLCSWRAESCIFGKWNLVMDNSANSFSSILLQDNSLVFQATLEIRVSWVRVRLWSAWYLFQLGFQIGGEAIQ